MERFRVKEEALFKEMAKLDRELQEMIESNPELEEVYLKSKHDPEFQAELDYLLRTFVGRW